MSETIKYFDGVSFNLNDKTMTIENGTNGHLIIDGLKELWY